MIAKISDETSWVIIAAVVLAVLIGSSLLEARKKDPGAFRLKVEEWKGTGFEIGKWVLIGLAGFALLKCASWDDRSNQERWEDSRGR